MYIPQHFRESRLSVLHELMRLHPLATLVTASGDQLLVNHIPLLLDPDTGDAGTLRGHVARANPVWKQLAQSAAAVAIFQGPQTYISPSWYPGKEVDGRAVPTWNYAVVHAHGFVRVHDNVEWLRAHVTELTNAHEVKRSEPWQVSDAPADYIDRMLTAIVGIELPVSRLEGKWKVSQNRSQDDRLGVASGLRSQSDDTSLAMAGLVARV
jgi:transcriptional regulator